MKRTLALLLAIVMMLSLLAACGETKSPAGDKPDEENIDATPKPQDDKEFEDDKESGDDEAGDITLTLNETEVTLSAEGAAFRLKCDVEPAVDAIIMYTSSDESVAAVSDDGTITAVAPGDAVITAECMGAIAECAVKCDWEEETPAPETAPVTAPETAPVTAPVTAPEPQTPEAPPASAGVDLAAFCDAVQSRYDMAVMEDISGMSDILDNFYSGLSGISTRQCLVCVAMMTGVVSELALIEVDDAADVDAVKAILQARVDAQIEGGAFYPATVDGWTNNSRIVTNGNYIMMIVHQDCDSIVSDFNALF